VEAPWASWRVRAAAVAALALGVLALWLTGSLDAALEPARVRAFLADNGPLGPLAWLAAFALLQPFGVPGAAFIIPASLIWPPAVAIGVLVAGALGASGVAFGLARWIGREAIETRLPERVRRATAAARERPLRTVFWVRVLFFLFAPAHWALGVSGIRLGPLLAGSALGFLPVTTLWVLATREFAEEFTRVPRRGWLALTVAALLSLAALAWWRRRGRPARPTA
jgi:uncharacterized membrane protein YdjX (TVP38/TMEM64 family)